MESHTVDINVFRKALEFISVHVQQDIQLKTIEVFLYIATHENCSIIEVQEALSLNTGSSSRNVSIWTRRRYDRKPGLDYVESVIDDHDQRFKKLILTPKGRDFFNMLKGV